MGQRADAFAVGVMLYVLVVGDYPWQATRTESCNFFRFFREKGLLAFLGKKRMKTAEGKTVSLSTVLSPEFTGLLCDLLQPESSDRMTVTEALTSSWFQPDACDVVEPR